MGLFFVIITQYYKKKKRKNDNNFLLIYINSNIFIRNIFKQALYYVRSLFCIWDYCLDVTILVKTNK